MATTSATDTNGGLDWPSKRSGATMKAKGLTQTSQRTGTSLTVSATASSGLPVTFTVVQNGNCSVSGNVVTFLNYGNCGIIANQSGNASYTAATAVGQIVPITN